MRVAILCPVHSGDGARIIRQLKNYEYWLSRETGIRHYFLHFSRESSQEAKDAVIEYSKQYGMQVTVNTKSEQTSFNTALGAILGLNDMLAESKINYTNIYYHTDSDLLFRQGLISYIERYAFGIRELGRIDYDHSEWYHANRMRRDPRLKVFVTKVLNGNYDELRIGRIEGIFARQSIWTLALEVIQEFFSDEYFEDKANHWCAEEVLLPTLFLYLKQRFGRFWLTSLNAIYIKTQGESREDRILTCQEVRQLRDDAIYFGGKWFSHADDEAVSLCMNATR